MNYTSIEQSKKLVELGLNPETADMCYDLGEGETKAHLECENFICYFTNDEYPECADRYIPCWSLGALLGLMPAGCSLRSRKGFTADKKIYFCTCPFNNDDPINYNSSIEAAYNMVIWLLENNYIKAEKT